MVFQSTHPVRGATCDARVQADRLPISIHAPRAGCDARAHSDDHGNLTISIHAPRAGCDLTLAHPHIVGDDFNPRTPCGVRPFPPPLRQSCKCISIHAPRAGCDRGGGTRSQTTAHFNPRTPCGVRRQTCTTWFAPIFATLPNQMYVCLHYTCFTTLFQPKTWFSAVFQRCEAPRESMSAPASHRVKASAAPPAHRSAWRRYAQRGSDSYSQDCKSAGCPSPG